MVHQLRENPTSGWPERRSIVYGEWVPYPSDEAAVYFMEQRQRAAERAVFRRRVMVERAGFLVLSLVTSVAVVVTLHGIRVR